MARLVPSSLTTDAYRALKDAILNLELAPGTVLVEQQLATTLGISKTPVREALARLMAEGFVEAEPGRKVRVVGLSATTVRDLYHVRLLLEPAAISEVAERVTDENVRRLDRLVDEAKKSLESGEAITFVAANEQFHSYLIELTGNQYLVATFRRIFDHVHRVRAAIHQTEHEARQYDFALQGIVNHRHIVDALRERDPAAACEAMRTDIQLFLDMAAIPDFQDALSRRLTEDIAS
jgi:DNA-binding GntR family transcriptional regulator